MTTTEFATALVTHNIRQAALEKVTEMCIDSRDISYLRSKSAIRLPENWDSKSAFLDGSLLYLTYIVRDCAECYWRYLPTISSTIKTTDELINLLATAAYNCFLNILFAQAVSTIVFSKATQLIEQPIAAHFLGPSAADIERHDCTATYPNYSFRAELDFPGYKFFSKFVFSFNPHNTAVLAVKHALTIAELSELPIDLNVSGGVGYRSFIDTYSSYSNLTTDIWAKLQKFAERVKTD